MRWRRRRSGSKRVQSCRSETRCFQAIQKSWSGSIMLLVAWWVNSAPRAELRVSMVAPLDLFGKIRVKAPTSLRPPLVPPQGDSTAHCKRVPGGETRGNLKPVEGNLMTIIRCHLQMCLAWGECQPYLLRPWIVTPGPLSYEIDQASLASTV